MYKNSNKISKLFIILIILFFLDIHPLFIPHILRQVSSMSFKHTNLNVKFINLKLISFKTLNKGICIRLLYHVFASEQHRII